MSNYLFKTLLVVCALGFVYAVEPRKVEPKDAKKEDLQVAAGHYGHEGHPLTSGKELAFGHGYGSSHGHGHGHTQVYGHQGQSHGHEHGHSHTHGHGHSHTHGHGHSHTHGHDHAQTHSHRGQIHGHGHGHSHNHGRHPLIYGHQGQSQGYEQSHIHGQGHVQTHGQQGHSNNHFHGQCNCGHGHGYSANRHWQPYVGSHIQNTGHLGQSYRYGQVGHGYWQPYTQPHHQSHGYSQTFGNGNSFPGFSFARGHHDHTQQQYGNGRSHYHGSLYHEPNQSHYQH